MARTPTRKAAAPAVKAPPAPASDRIVEAGIEDIARIAYAASRENHLIDHLANVPGDFDLQTWEFALRQTRLLEIGRVEELAAGANPTSVFDLVALALLKGKVGN